MLQGTGSVQHDRSGVESSFVDAPADDTPGDTQSGAALRQAVLLLLPAALVAWVAIASAAGLVMAVDGDVERLDAFRRLLVLDRPIAFASVAAIVWAAVIAPVWPHERLRTLIAVLAAQPRLVAMAVFVLLAAASVVVYQRHPLSMDEFAPMFQATAFARGSLTGQMDAELLPRLFAPGMIGYFFTASAETGQIISNYWPGHALLLTPFILLGVPWLLNPLLAALSVLLIHRLTRRLTDDPLAPGWAVLFCVASPAFMVNGISYYSMAGHLLLSLGFVLLLLEPGGMRAVWAGLVGSVALTFHNPYAHVLFAAPWVLWLGWRRGLRPAFHLVLGYLPLTIVLGCGWLWLRWRVGTAGAGFTFDTSGVSVFDGVQSVFADAFAKPGAPVIAIRAAEFVKLWVWAVPALPVLACIGFIRHRGSPFARLLASSGALMLSGYLVFALSQGHGWGNRYFHPVWMVLPVFAALALVPAGSRAISRERVSGAVAIAGLILVNVVALWQVRAFIRGHLAQLPGSGDRSDVAVVLIDPLQGFYTSDLIQNDPMLRVAPIVLVSRGMADDIRFMTARFPKLSPIATGPNGSAWAPTIEPTDR